MSKAKGYEAQFEDAVTAGDVVPVTAEIVRWENTGQSITGELLNVDLLKDGKFDTEVNTYHILTDDGLKSCVLGSATDAQIEGRVAIHDLLRITYQGKVELQDGKSANKFKIEVVSGKAKSKTANKG